MMSDPRQSLASLLASPGNSRCSRTCRYFTAYRVVSWQLSFPTGLVWLICSKNNNLAGRCNRGCQSIVAAQLLSLLAAPSTNYCGSAHQFLRLCQQTLYFSTCHSRRTPFFPLFLAQASLAGPLRREKRENEKKKYEEEWLGCVLLSEFEVREYFAARREIRS